MCVCFQVLFIVWHYECVTNNDRFLYSLNSWMHLSASSPYLFDDLLVTQSAAGHLTRCRLHMFPPDWLP